MGGCSSLRPSSPVQKEEGLREEHGSARQIARGPLCGAAMAFPQKRPRSGGGSEAPRQTRGWGAAKSIL